MSDSTIKAVLFDLGDTLLNFGPVNARSLFKEAARRSYDYLESLGREVGSFRSYLRHNMFRLRARMLWADMTGRDFDSLGVLRRHWQRKGLQLEDEQWEQFHWFWYEPLAEKATIEPDLPQTLSDLREMGLKLGIISNTFISGCALDRHLEQFDLMQFFPLRLYSSDHRIRKPGKRMFLTATQRLEVQTAQTVYVGDRFEVDVAGALAVGMKPVLKRAYTNAKFTNQSYRTFSIIEKISELPAMIPSLAKKHSTL